MVLSILIVFLLHSVQVVREVFWVIGNVIVDGLPEQRQFVLDQFGGAISMLKVNICFFFKKLFLFS